MKIAFFALSLIAVSAGVIVCLRQLRLAQPPPILVSSAGPTVDRIEKLSQILVSRVHIADVLIGVSDDSRAAFLIRGDALIGLDLNRAVITEKDQAQKRATILLPQPRVILARVDHERSKVYEYRSTSWIPWHSQSGRLLEEAMLQAQRMVAMAASSPENIEQARRQAEVIIASFFSELGWTVTVTFVSSDKPAETDK